MILKMKATTFYKATSLGFSIQAYAVDNSSAAPHPIKGPLLYTPSYATLLNLTSKMLSFFKLKKQNYASMTFIVIFLNLLFLPL